MVRVKVRATPLNKTLLFVHILNRDEFAGVYNLAYDVYQIALDIEHQTFRKARATKWLCEKVKAEIDWLKSEGMESRKMWLSGSFWLNVAANLFELYQLYKNNKLRFDIWEEEDAEELVIDDEYYALIKAFLSPMAVRRIMGLMIGTWNYDILTLSDVAMVVDFETLTNCDAMKELEANEELLQATKEEAEKYLSYNRLML